MIFGYYAPSPWGDYKEFKADANKRYATAIDALDDHDFCLEVMDKAMSLHRLYFSRNINPDAVNKLKVLCPFCEEPMTNTGIVNTTTRTALFECKACKEE